MQDPPIEIEVELIEHALSELLDSPIFRSSKQCQLLLRYIVDNTLAHHEDLLRERVIGASVFGRPPDYDTGNDPIVRGRAAEVRKRLAQFYLDPQDNSAIQISIPSGSYRAVFSHNHRSHPAKGLESTSKIAAANDSPMASIALEPVEATVGTKEIEARPIQRRHLHSPKTTWIALAAIVAIAGGGLALLHWQGHARKSDFEQFWAPFSKSSKPTLIYIGTSPSLRFAPGYVENYLAHHPEVIHLGGAFIGLPSSGSISTQDLIPYNGSIGFGDVAATARIASMLVSSGQVYDLRYGNDISISDMRSSPVVLIGGYTNSWTLQVTRNLRYTFDRGGRIVDRKDSSKEWHQSINSSSLQQDDYAVVSRLMSSETGGVVLAIAGLRGPGNQATADFLTDRHEVEKMLQNAPLGWERMNMQAVLRTKTINGVPKGADVQAIHFW